MGLLDDGGEALTVTKKMMGLMMDVDDNELLERPSPL